MRAITFHDREVTSSLRERKLFKDFLLKLFKSEKISLKKIDIIFCNDMYLFGLNKYHFNHNYFTDTITFLLSDIGKPVVGEVYISIQRVKSNSLRFNTHYPLELKRVIIHGCLHLCGYKDKPKLEFGIMEKLQESYVSKWIVSRET